MPEHIGPNDPQAQKILEKSQIRTAQARIADLKDKKDLSPAETRDGSALLDIGEKAVLSREASKSRRSSPGTSSPLDSSSDEGITPRELHQKAVLLEKHGDKVNAAVLYERAGYLFKAVKIYEESGDISQAYRVAKQSGDDWTADRLASEHKIANHEFSQFPPARGRDFNEVMAEALSSRLQKGATAERLGFHGFEGKKVADVGTRDGRFVSLFRGLGAADVYGIDPDKAELEKAVHKGLLDQEHALPTRIEDIPTGLKGTFDVATIFNFNVPITHRDGFAKAVREHSQKRARLLLLSQSETS